jgi:hypothetical protein
MQRHLGDPPEDPRPEVPDETPGTDQEVSEAPTEMAMAAPLPTRGPSDTELRKRQRAWRLERARFEASKTTGSTLDPDAH